MMCFFLMLRLPPRSTRTDTRFPYTTLFRSPSVIFSSTAEGRRDRMLSHPTLRRLSEQVAIRDYPPRLLHCAGPAFIDAVTRLSQVRRSVSGQFRSEEHTSELQSLIRISYAVF